MDTRLRVLLADDDQDDYVITRDLFESIGRERFKLDWAQTYEAAIRAVALHEHDLYLFDYRLGEADGLELLAEALDRGCKAPIILLTGYDDWETDVRAMKAGASDYLVKHHLDPKLLERSVRYALERKQTEDKLKAYAAEVEIKNRELAEAVRVAREATELKSQFLANVSHEIRTPMNGILGMLDVAMDAAPRSENDGHLRDYLETARASASALMIILNDILDFSKIEACRMELEETPISVGAVVYEAISTLAVVAQKKGLQLGHEISDDMPLALLGDPTRLRQVLMNLINNAIKFTERGSIEVRARVRFMESAEAVIEFSVADTGIGMSEKQRAVVFEAFRQADGSITRRYGGTGLGLSISQRLASLMGGELWVNSQPGEGSTFYFTARLKTARGASALATA